MVLKQEGNDIRIENDLGHADGTARLWPRNSWSHSMNSSMDSSSGQKSPCSTDTSVIGPVPCSAINCLTDGNPAGAKGTVAGLSFTVLPAWSRFTLIRVYQPSAKPE